MSRDVGPGTIACFSDGQRIHNAIILSVSQDKRDAWTLFLTSNPKWNRKSRLATSDELALCGVPKSKETFLAPVVRPVQDASVVSATFPEDRVTSLSKEFGPDPFAPLIFTLPPDMYPPVRVVKPQMPKKLLHEYLLVEAKKKSNVAAFPDKDALKDFLGGEAVLPRSGLRKLISGYPALTEFFVRRSSVTMSLQVVWERTGRILAEHLAEQKIPRKLLAARMGVPERDILAFETGLQVPSYQEMLTIAAFLPEIPDEWSLPSSVPLLCDCVSIALIHSGWSFQKAASAVRIPYQRLHDMLVMAMRPTNDELKRLKTICPEIPPWRAYWEHLDGQVELMVELEKARKRSGR